MPESRVRSGAQPGRSTLGGSMVTIRSGMVDAADHRDPAAHRLAGHGARQGAEHLECEHQAVASARVEAARRRAGAGPVDDRPARPSAHADTAVRRGAPRPGCPPRPAAAGRSGSRRSRTTRPGRCRWPRRRTASRRRATHPPAARRPGGRCTRPIVDGQLGRLDVVEERQQRPGQRSDRPGDQHGGVPGGLVLAHPAYGGRGEPRQHVAGEVLVDDLVEHGQLGAGVLAIGGAEELAALAALGLHQARHLGRDPADLGHALRRRQLAQPQPQVALDHVGRQQRAVHVEERRHLGVLARLHLPQLARVGPRPRRVGDRPGRGSVRSPPGSGCPGGRPSSPRPRCRRRTSPGRSSDSDSNNAIVRRVVEVQLRLRVLAVEVEVAAQELQPSALLVELAGQVAGAVAPRCVPDHVVGGLVRLLAGHEQPFDRLRAREPPVGQPRRPPVADR